MVDFHVEHRDNTSASPPVHSNDTRKNSQLFLGLIKKRYVKTFAGAIHGISSLLAMILGAYVFFAKTFGLETHTAMGNGVSSKLIYGLFFSNALSAGIVIIFFWNKVQSWRLGTSKTTEKGVSATQMQNANRGRGVVTLALQSIYPLVMATAPQDLLEDTLFSCAVALAMVGLALYVYILIKDYFRPLINVFGAFQVGLAIAIIFHGSIGSLSREYPELLNHVEQEAAYVISLVQHGFLLYYLYSRQLISETTVNKQAKTYHSVVVTIAIARNAVRALNGYPYLPVQMVPQAIVGLLLVMLPLFKVTWGNPQERRGITKALYPHQTRKHGHVKSN